MPSDSSQMISGIVARAFGGLPSSNRSKSTHDPRERDERAADEAQRGQASRHQARPVHQPAEDQAVSDADGEAGSEQEHPILDRGERLGVPGERGGVGPGVVSQRHDGKDGDDADEDEDAFHDASGDVAEREDLTLPFHDRPQNEGRPDVRDDQEQLQQRSEVDAGVLTAPADVALGIVEHRLIETERWDRRDERDEVERPKDDRKPSL